MGERSADSGMDECGSGGQAHLSESTPCGFLGDDFRTSTPSHDKRVTVDRE